MRFTSSKPRGYSGKENSKNKLKKRSLTAEVAVFVPAVHGISSTAREGKYKRVRQKRYNTMSNLTGEIDTKG